MNQRHRFHSICPYFAMFPESFVRRNVLAWSKRADVVLDPFSGRGTTVFESLLNGRKAIGCDTNPVAACISRAKIDPPKLPEILTRLAELERKCARFTSKAAEVADEFFMLCFHKKTLRQLLFLKRTWNGERRASIASLQRLPSAAFTAKVIGRSYALVIVCRARSAPNLPIPFGGGRETNACRLSGMFFLSFGQLRNIDISRPFPRSRGALLRVTFARRVACSVPTKIR